MLVICCIILALIWPLNRSYTVQIFNRVITVLLLVLLLLLALTLAIVPQRALMLASGWLSAGSTAVGEMQVSSPMIVLAGRFALALVALLLFGILLWGEVKPERRSVRVRSGNGTRAEVATESVERRLAWRLDQLADVVSAHPRVQANRNSVDVWLDVETTPEIDVPMKTDEVLATTREVITERMGLQPGKIQVRIRHSPYGERT